MSATRGPHARNTGVPPIPAVTNGFQPLGGDPVEKRDLSGDSSSSACENRTRRCASTHLTATAIQCVLNLRLHDVVHEAGDENALTGLLVAIRRAVFVVVFVVVDLLVFLLWRGLVCLSLFVFLFVGGLSAVVWIIEIWKKSSYDTVRGVLKSGRGRREGKQWQRTVFTLALRIALVARSVLLCCQAMRSSAQGLRISKECLW